MFKDSLRTAIQIRANEGRLPAKRRKNATTEDCGGGNRLLSAGYTGTTWCRIKRYWKYEASAAVYNLYMYFNEAFIQAKQ